MPDDVAASLAGSKQWDETAVDPGFSDFSLQELCQRSAHLTVESAAWQSWGISKEAHSERDQASAWTVPDDILECIPTKTKKLLGCEREALVVSRNLHFMDIFAGRARFTRWALWAGFTGIAFDLQYGNHMNTNSDEGFALLLLCVLRVMPLGLLLLAPLCSSWGFLPMSITKRKACNPLGDPAVPMVAEGNLMNGRVACICMLAHKLGLRWIVEQPRDSMFFMTPAMKACLTACSAQKVRFQLRDFGHPNPKPTVLYGNDLCHWLHQVAPKVSLKPLTLNP